MQPGRPPRPRPQLTSVLLLQVPHAQLVLRLHLRAIGPPRGGIPGPGHGAEPRTARGHQADATRSQGAQSARSCRRHIVCLQRAPAARPRPPLGDAHALDGRLATWPRPLSSGPAQALIAQVVRERQVCAASETLVSCHHREEASSLSYGNAKGTHSEVLEGFASLPSLGYSLGL